MLSGGVLDPPPGRNGFLVFLQDRVSEHKSWEEDLRVWVSAFFPLFFPHLCLILKTESY
jgi:hypothetical protein